MANPERSTQEKVGHYAIYGGVVKRLTQLFAEQPFAGSNPVRASQYKFGAEHHTRPLF